MGVAAGKPKTKATPVEICINAALDMGSTPIASTKNSTSNVDKSSTDQNTAGASYLNNIYLNSLLNLVITKQTRCKINKFLYKTDIIDTYIPHVSITMQFTE